MLPIRKIGVISDTHISTKAKFIPPEVLEGLKGVDLILHAGDILQAEILEQLALIAPVEAVAGNNDSAELTAKLGLTKIIQAGHKRIGLIHGHGSRGTTLERAIKAFQDVDCIVFGHNHFPYNVVHDGVLIFNPGSPTDKRRLPQASFGFLICDDEIRGEIVYF